MSHSRCWPGAGGLLGKGRQGFKGQVTEGLGLRRLNTDQGLGLEHAQELRTKKDLETIWQTSRATSDLYSALQEGSHQPHMAVSPWNVCLFLIVTCCKCKGTPHSKRDMKEKNIKYLVGNFYTD